jgi:hypothetical protein
MDTTQLLSAIKRRAYIPAAGSQFSDTQILAIADEASTEVALPLVLSAREGFLELVEPIELVNGTAAYDLPDRATGGSILWVRYLDSNNPSYTFEIPHADEKEMTQYPQVGYPPSGAVWYFFGDQIVLAPPPSLSTGQLIVNYTARPNALVPVASALTIVSMPAGAFVLSGTAASIGISTGTVIDIVGASRSHMWSIIGATATVDGVDPTKITISGGEGVENYAVGDYVCLAKQTPVPQFPDEVHTFIVLETARRLCLAMRSPMAGALAAEVQDMRTRIADLVSPRAVKSSKRAINRTGAARTRRTWRWYW